MTASHFRSIALYLGMALAVALPPAITQAQTAPAPPPDRSTTGGAQTLEDILARQRGLTIDDQFRRGATGDPSHAAPADAPLGTLGGVSDPEFWRALRYGSADLAVSSRAPAAEQVIQTGGMTWLKFREGLLVRWGGRLLLATLALLAVFFLLRGRVRLDGAWSGRKIMRFGGIERYGHWLTAGSFVLLGLTGLTQLLGRQFIIPWLGRDAYARVALLSKWVHSNVAWAFILGLVLIFVLWVRHNLPHWSDLRWLAKGGGMLTRGVHPPARKFNAGQKLIFWAVVLLGGSIAVSGLSLLFPFRIPLFAASFSLLNDLGLPQLVGLAPLPVDLAPQQEMQLAQSWHAIVAFVLIAIVLAHIYIGTLGMEGAFDAMGSGEVDEEWAKEHHSLWLEETRAAQGADARTEPAE